MKKKKKEKRKSSTIAFESEEFRRHGGIAQTPQTAVVEVEKGKTVFG